MQQPVAGPAAGGPTGAQGPGPDATGQGPAGSPWAWSQADYGYRYGRGPLYRSRTDRVVAGVCAGLAEHFGWDPSATRVGYAVLAIFTGILPMLFLYIVMAIVVPNGPTRAGAPGYPDAPPVAWPAARANGGGAAAIVFGALLIIGGGIALLDRFFVVDWNLLGPVFVVGLGVLLIGLSLSRRS